MSTVPNTFASTSIFKGDITTQDFLHLVRESDGSILGWLDENGIPQGSMAIGGGGGGSSIFIEGTPVSNPNFLAGPGVAFAILGSNVTLSNTGVLSLNSQTGALTAVLSLNSLIGALNITAGSGIGVTPSGTSIAIVNQGVRSLNSLTGTPSIAGGTGLSVTPSGSTIALANTGVTSIAGTTGISVSASTGAVSVSVSLPWLDIQDFGGQPKAAGVADQTTSYTSSGGTPNVTLGSTRALFANGTGICLYQAGNATTQSTPSAPTITSPVVQGAQTIIYKAVGYDAMGGLTAASSPQAVTNAPKIFGPLPQVISSITATGGVVTVTFAGPLNNAVSAGMTLHIVKVTGSGATWNGIWTIASVISTSEVTYNVSGATGTGTVSASSTGRVSNTAIITSVARSSAGVLTINTAAAHNYQAGSVNVPTVINVEGVLNAAGTSSDLNGWYPIATASGTTITTFPCGIFTAETGVESLGLRQRRFGNITRSSVPPFPEQRLVITSIRIQSILAVRWS